MTSRKKFRGSAANSLGQKGTTYLWISGNVVKVSTDWPGQTVRATMYPSSKSMSLSGKDTNGCSVVAWKN